MMTNLLNGAHVANKLFSTIARLRLLLVMFVALCVSTEVWGAISSPSVCVFASSSGTALSDNNNDVTWTASTQPTGFENDGDKRGLQWSGSIVGDGGLTLSCSNYASYTITEIEVVWSRNNGAGASVSATVGGSAFGTTDSNTQKTTNRTATFSGSAKGNIIITATSTATKNSFYIKSITVTYESAGSSTIAVTNVTLNESALALTEGDTEQLIATIEPDNATNKNVSWESNNLSVATVVDGLVTAVAEGNAIITVTTEDGNKIATCNVTVNPKPKYTVTLVPGSGSVTDTELEEPNAGDGVTLPTPTLSSACQSAGWSFAGWAEASVATETEDAPTTLYEAGDTYKPTANTTLYAVYQRTDGGGGGGGEASLTEMVANNTLSDGDKIVVIAQGTYSDEYYNVAMYQETVESSYVNKWDCSTLTADVVADDDKNWWIVTMTNGGFYLGDDTNGYLNMSSNNLYCNANKSVWTLLDLEDGTFKLQSNSRYLSFRADLTNKYWRMGGKDFGTSGLTVLKLYKYTEGTTSTTYYHSTPDCGITQPSVCTIIYDANGGEGTITDATEYTNGANVTVKGNFGNFTKEGYAFTGWNTKADGSGDSYKHNDQFIITDNTILYAQWCEAYWKLVTDAAELENDTRIVIAAKDETVALSTDQKTNNRGQAAITKKYNTITFGADVQTLSLVGLQDNQFTLYTGSGHLYAAGSGSNNNYLRTGVSDGNDDWDIAISQGTATATILAKGTNTNNQLKYNAGSDLFSCYGEGNSQKDVVIYKEVCVQDQYNVTSNLTNATANTNPTTVASNATSLTLNYSANTGYLLPETITVKMGGVELVSGMDYDWNKETGVLTITVIGFYGDIDVKIVAEVDPCYGFAMSEVTATSTTNSVTLSWSNVEGATSYNITLNPGDFSVSTGNTSHTFEGLSPNTSYNWEVQAVKGTCQASQTGSIATQKESFTVSWVVNGNTTTTESVVDGESITQYPSAPSAPSGCHEKVFVGWTNTPINTPTNAAPATLYKQKSDVPTITGNTTLHAVWATAIGGGETTKSLLNDEIKSFHVQGTTTSYSDLTVPSTDGDWSGLFCTANSSSVYTINLKKSLVDGNRPYLKSSEYNNITKVSVIATHTSTQGNRTLYLCNAATNSPESNNIGTISIAKDNNSPQLCTLSSSATTLYLYVDNGIQIKTITLTTGGTTYSAYTTLCDECTLSESLVLSANASTADLDINGKATITFSTTGGNGGAITYVANPNTGVTWENGTATFTKAGEYSITASQGKNGENCPTTSNTVNVTITAIPHLYFVTEPADPIVFDPVECGGNTRVEDKKSVELQGYNLTGNVTVNVTGAYKIARTSSATLGEYSNSLTLDKNKTDGKINGNYDIVYILSFPPAGGTASTEGTLTFTTQGGEQLTVNLSTPTVTCTLRTLTFNDRGNTTTQEYYAGAEVPQPEDPTGVCTIPVNYVFDGWAEAEVTDGSTSYTKVNFPYSMPAKNTTLYAVYRYTEENANSDKFMSVDKELGELVSGMDYVLTGYYDADQYAMSITASYETGKYKTKYVDVQESSILYEEDIPYYEFTTTDNEIIWTIEGDEANGYTFQNKSNNKYLAVSDDKLTLSDNAAKFTIEHETGVENDEEVYYMSLLIQPVGSTKYLSSYYKDAVGVLFNLHTTSTLSLYLYKRVASNLYTTSPDCGGIAITYDLNGGDGGHCTDTRVEGGSDYTICEDVPTKTGYTFLHWSYGVNTYNPSDVIENVTADITLTAQWQINTYTVTWSNNGATTPVTYEHGDDLTLPSAPESCDGVKEFVGWTEDNTFTYHATTPPSDLFTEKTASVTADATYYAVFATKGEGSANFVLGESGTFKMYANVNGTNYYAQGGVSSSKITSTTEAANASDYTLTYADGVYSIKQGTSNVGNKADDANLNTNETTWTISEGTNGSWRVTSNVSTSRALSYSTSTSAFKAYSIGNITGSPTIYYDIEFGGTSSGYSDYTTICQQIESIEVQDPQTEFYITDNFTIGSGKVIATLSGGGTADVTSLATFSGYNMNVVGTYTVTVTYMGATATYNINVKPLDNAWVLTWNVSGKTNTGLSPRSVTKGNAIGTLPVPEVPAACEGKTFMGWTESNIVPSDGKGIVYITEATKPTDNTTYYAVFATVNNFCKQMPIEDIESGSKVVVVAVASLTADGGSGKAISSRATDDTHNLQGDSVAIYDETINTPHSTCIWTITKEDGKCVFKQDGKYLNGVLDGPYSNLKYLEIEDSWTLTPAQSGMTMTYNMESTNASGEYIEWYRGKFAIHNEVNENGDFDMQFYVTLGDGADITDYTTGCEEYTITYYGFRGGYSTSTSSDGIIVLPVNSSHTVPDCGDVVTDHTNLGREFLDVWMTQPHGGHTFKPGDTFILTQDTTLYAQWKLETTSDVTTLPTDIEDMAGTDVYVYGGTALNIQPGSTTINSLTLKGGIQSDGSYKMPTVWVPEGATLIRNSNKIYLDLAINAKNYYPFAVPFATKNDQYIDYLDPVLREASIYGTHFVIKTYDGAQRAKIGEDRDNNWVRVLRHQSAEEPSYLQPGVGYIITALTYPDKETATIRIPMTVPNTWFENGEQTVVGTTTRNTVSVVGHTGEAAEEHQRHAGWNFVASPYLSNFSGNNIGGAQSYINGWIDVTNGLFPYYDTEVPYVTVPVADFAYYKQTKVAEATLSPEWSFFVQIDANAGGTMNFAIEGRKQAPASVAARYAEERPVKMDVDITLTNGSESDQTGLIICDYYTHEYEIGRDLEKMFGSAYNLVVYSIMQDKTPLAYQALPIQHDMQVIPIGYRAPAKGEYTFSLNATSSIELLSEKYEQLILEDYETGARTNLLEANYTFDSERTQSDTRFVIYPVLRKNTPTDVPNILDNSQTTHKLFHNGHLYIIHEGRVYNGNGQIVK